MNALKDDPYFNKTSNELSKPAIGDIEDCVGNKKQHILKQIQKLIKGNNNCENQKFSSQSKKNKARNYESLNTIEDNELIFAYPPIVYEDKCYSSSIWNHIAQCSSITCKQPPKGLDLKAMLMRRKYEHERYDKIFESFTKGK